MTIPAPYICAASCAAILRPDLAAALVQLLEAEAIMNDDRIKKQATYSVARHVEALVAIMAEAQTLHATRPST
jgi:hypothetical protein